MRPLSARDVLEVWEADRGHSATASALALLGAACPDTPREELLTLPVGERDRRLLELRRCTLGSSLESVGRCPACGLEVELSFTTDALAPAPREPAGETVLERGTLTLRLRLPTSEDLLVAEECSSVAEARELLFRHSVVEARRGGVPVSVEELSEEEEAAAEEALAEADVQAVMDLTAICPGCGHRWRAHFDVARFFAEEIGTHARRLLGEVHALARAYGWSEAAILSLSARRRRAYLARVWA